MYNDDDAVAKLDGYVISVVNAAALVGERTLVRIEKVGRSAAQASLVAQWMLVGFVHGVMNTDNTTISGETIDYGPCAFLDAYDPATVFSSIDEGGRYAYGNQPVVAEWDLARLAEAMLPLLADDEDAAIERAVASLGGFRPAYSAVWTAGMRAKLGLPADLDDAVAAPLVADLLGQDTDEGRVLHRTQHPCRSSVDEAPPPVTDRAVGVQPQAGHRDVAGALDR